MMAARGASRSGLVPVSAWSANAGRAARLSAGPSEGVLVRGESRSEFVEVPRPRPRSSGPSASGVAFSWEDNFCQVPRQCWSPSCCLSRFCGDVLFQIVGDQPCFRRCLLKCMPRCASAARPCWGALALPSASALALVFVLIKDKTDQTWTKLLSNQALNREPTI
jgi:hypothetical protein